ncbi:MAG: hybrid sensor histidine kinase/response regulator [Candidatus Omnitrophota bacterium]
MIMKETHVVIVDDELNILNSLVRVFKDEAFGVFVTTDYKEALSMLEGEKIKVIVSDHRMPDISGTEFLRKAKEKYPDIIRILFTGYTDMHIAEDAINKGEVYRFINKPWEDTALRAVVREAMGRYDLEEKNRKLTGKIKEQNEELLAVNSQLKNMYEAQKEFSSTVSHELRTPLASIKTIVDIILSGTAGELSADQKNFLVKIKSNIDRLGRLINDILCLSKLESGKAALNILRHDINATVKEVIDVQRPVAEKKGLYLNARLLPEAARIFFDDDKINQVLNNLISNAVKFTNSGGIDVSVTADQANNNVLISVKDTGPGIKEEDKPKLFQKFQQLGDHATREMGGTGLGLAICKEIIAKHGGRIWVTSRFGEGSEFFFLLPVKERRQDE